MEQASNNMTLYVPLKSAKRTTKMNKKKQQLKVKINVKSVNFGLEPETGFGFLSLAWAEGSILHFHAQN